MNLVKSNYKNILILGFGGAGKAIYFTLKKNTKNKNITVVSRSKKIIEMKKKKKLNVIIGKFTKFNKINDVIVNCTSVGYLNHDKAIPKK